MINLNSQNMCVQSYMTINYRKRLKQYDMVLLYIFLASTFSLLLPQQSVFLFTYSSSSLLPSSVYTFYISPLLCFPFPFASFPIFILLFFLPSILSAVCCCLWKGNVCVKAQPLKLLLFLCCCLCFGIVELRVE